MWLHQPVDPPVISPVTVVPGVPLVSSVPLVSGVPPGGIVPGLPPGPVTTEEKHLLLILILMVYVTIYVHLCHFSNLTVVGQCS